MELESFVDSYAHFMGLVKASLELRHIVTSWTTLFLHGVCMLRKCIYGESTH